MGCGGSVASETTSSDSTNASSGESSGDEAPLTLADFTAQVAEAALPGVCGRPDSSLRGCFTVDEQTCGAAFTAMMVGCSEHAEELGLPATVTEQSAEPTARTIAQCAVQAYTMSMRAEGMVLQTPECQPTAD